MLNRKRSERLKVIEQVTLWTRERFELPEGTAMIVAEIACPLPGCPPIETVVAFWIAERRYQFKLFKPMGEVIHDDLPYSWLKETLAVEEGVGWECC